MTKVKILGESFEVLDMLTKINISDSFVMPKNKIGGGNGEAKLYIGQEGDKLINLFGQRGFKINCILSKHNLLEYLDNAYSDYFEPQQEYRFKDELPQKWEERRNRILELPDIIEFKIADQKQITGPRLYVNSINNDKSYGLIREIALPIISFLNLYKLKNEISNEIKYYFKLYINDFEDTLESEINENSQILDNRFVPNNDKSFEKELPELNQPTEIVIPFDPNKIKVRTTPSTIGQIIDDLVDGFINLDTEFQRRSNLWDINMKSRFIESLLLKLPIPAFYFNEKEENNLEVIDGLQRISTIKSYVIDKNFQLKNLEFLKDYNDFGFDSLPITLSRRIKTFPITNYIIEKGTPDEVKFNIFKRVNTGGLILTAQEIRHAINQGVPSKLVAELVRDEDNENEFEATKEGKAFAKATDYTIGSFRMEDRDFATRFVSFYLIKYHDYKPDLDTFLNNGMSKIKELTLLEIEKLKNDFYKAMTLAYDIWKEDAFRKRFNKKDSRKPINKALFEILSVTFARLSNEDVLKLKENKEILIDKFIQLHNKKEGSFLRSITQGTAKRESVITRFSSIENIINETLEYD